jgi:hypothetical protein
MKEKMEVVETSVEDKEREVSLLGEEAGHVAHAHLVRSQNLIVKLSVFVV